MSNQQAISQVFGMHVHTAHTGMPQLHGITYSQYQTLHSIIIYLSTSV